MSGAILKPRGQRCWRQTEATAGGRHGRPVGLVGVLRGRLMACMACPCYAVGRLQKHADDGLWGDRVPLRAFISTGLYAFGVETAVLSGEWRVLELLLRLTLGAARPGHVRPCTARRYRWGGRGRCPCRNFSLPPTPLRKASASGHGMSCRASGRVPGVHRRSYSRTAHEWYWACAVRLDPCFEQRRPNPHAVSVADQAQSRLVGRRYPVLHTQCAGITRVQSVGFRPSRSTRGANPEAALAPRAFLAPSCEGAVRERRLEFSDSVDAAGTGPSPAPICPRTNAPCGRRPRSPWPRPRPFGRGRGSCGARRR
ncbi:hypothetical protein RDI58_030127 [Solanum bulbocastanum]|uniref:Uncharacterized protein n=2 Tax=Solanum bulbocastanum TaxID=147425 RepID=A0AAN8SH51_SOLBU